MTLYGCDTSNNDFTSISQVAPLVTNMSQTGFSWIEAKVSQGSFFKDAYWQATQASAQAVGLPCIGYHFVDTSSPTAQAQNFVSNGGGNVAMLDFEAGAGTITNFWAVVNAFNAAGVTIALTYLPQWYWAQIGSPDLSQVPGLIASAYPTTASGYASVLYENGGASGGEGWASYGGAKPAIWQFTDAALVDGYKLDCNAFEGSLDQLTALLAGTPPPPPPPPPSHHIVLTVAGTGSDMWNTTSPQPALIGSTLAANMPDTYFWQPVGDYPAATFPMGPSVTAGVQSLIYLTTGETYEGFNITPGQTYPQNSLILCGYSQGGLVVCQFIQWCYQFNRMDILERIVCVAVWGNPQRLEGFASGNEFAGWPMPADKDGSPTGGIAQGVNANGPANMTLAQMQPQLKTPVTHYWGDFVNTNDSDTGATELYANAPQNGVGTVEQSIFNAVQNLDAATALGVLEDLTIPVDMGLAILNGFQFLGAGMNADHYSYQTQPIYDFVALAGSETAPWGPV